MDHLFESPWLKNLGRAIQHAQALKAEIDEDQTADDPLLSVRTEYQSGRHGFAVYATAVRPVPSSWGLLLGDIAFNFRCALDHLAWALVSRGRTPPETLTPTQQKGVPTSPSPSDNEDFNSSLAGMLPGVGRSDIAKVRATQPYHNGRKQVRHNFVILAALNNHDKHRSFQPVWDHTVLLGLQVTDSCDISNIRVSPLIRGARELRVGAELAFIRVRKTGPHPCLEVATERKGIPSIPPGVSLDEWVTQTGVQIGLLLREFSAPPDEVQEAIRDWLGT